MTKRQRLSNYEVEWAVYDYLKDCGVRDYILFNTSARLYNEIFDKAMQLENFRDDGTTYGFTVREAYNTRTYTDGVQSALTIRELAALYIEIFLYDAIKHKDITELEADEILLMVTKGEYKYSESQCVRMRLMYSSGYQLEHALVSEEQKRINELKIAGKML